jgi:hypothetical protein
MDAETKKVFDLIALLSDAFWQRLNQPGISALDALREEYRPKSDEEKAIWSEITAPHNHAPLRRFVEGKNKAEITGYAARLYETLLADSIRRWESTKNQNH